MNLYEDLKWRGLIKDTAGEDIEEKIKEVLTDCLLYTSPSPRD